jgi:hypothetical protein
MPQKRNILIKRASLYPLSFDDLSILQKTPARGARGRASYQALSSTRSYSQDSLLSRRSLVSYEGIYVIQILIIIIIFSIQFFLSYIKNVSRGWKME